MRRLLGLRDFVHDAIEKTTDLVEETHEAVAKKSIDTISMVEPLAPIARAVDSVRQASARTVFDGVRVTNRGVQAISDLGVTWVSRALDHVADLGPLSLRERSTERRSALAMRTAVSWAEGAESALNAVAGDFLEARDNGLSIKMTLRHDGRDLTLERHALSSSLPRLTGKIAVFVHGLGCSDSIWGQREDTLLEPRSFGGMLAQTLDYTPIYARYNTGRHVSQNGRDLAKLIDALVAAYPVEVENIALIGHSMGGLVARSAAHYGKALDLPMMNKLSHLMCIASPHFGAPLERAGGAVASVLSFFDTAATQVTAKVLNGRSAGIKDLGLGSVVDEEWMRDDATVDALTETRHAPFVDGVTYGYIAARVRPAGDALSELIGDMLVHVPSASGKHHDVTKHLPFHVGYVLEGANHMQLTTHPEVYRQIERFLAESPAR